jgi:hypothetical protein
MRLVKPFVAVLLASGLLVAGCSSGSSGSGAVSAKAQAALEPYLDAVREAAAGGNRDAVQKAVQQLKHEVQVERKGISASRQAAIDNAADAVLHDIEASPSPTPTLTPTDTNSGSPSTPPSTPPATVTITPSPTVTVSPPPVSTLSPSDTASSSGQGGDGDG